MSQTQECFHACNFGRCLLSVPTAYSLSNAPCVLAGVGINGTRKWPEVQLQLVQFARQQHVCLGIHIEAACCSPILQFCWAHTMLEFRPDITEGDYFNEGIERVTGEGNCRVAQGSKWQPFTPMSCAIL